MMKKISVEEFMSIVDSNKALSDKLKNYLGGETDSQKIGEKIVTFMQQEGYEITKHGMEEVSAAALESVSGGNAKETFKKVGKKVGHGVKRYFQWVGNEYLGYLDGIKEGFLAGIGYTPKESEEVELVSPVDPSIGPDIEG